MSASAKNREEWVIRCADRFMTGGGATSAMATEFAIDGADTECARSQNVSNWTPPESYADEEMKSWEE